MLKLNILSAQQSLNTDILRFRPHEKEFDSFKNSLAILLGKIDAGQTEENQKNNIRDFLRSLYPANEYEINVKNKQDLVIHLGANGASNVGVIVETKRPANKSEMISAGKPNAKAFHELVLYFMRERVDAQNNDLKYLIATNINEWFIFKAADFNDLFYLDKNFRRQYESWRDKGKTDSRTGAFYEEIAKPRLESLEKPFDCAYFNLRDYENAPEKDLIALYKIFSPFHLLKKPFENDSNTLDKNFYAELLHIIGLEETKEKNKTLIKRKSVPDDGSLLEKAIAKLDTKYFVFRQEMWKQYGQTKDEQIYHAALELCIVWINRILFLKLLEAQLVSYHETDAAYRFLNFGTVNNFNELYTLFHDVLNAREETRRPALKETYRRVPYLNSSLFDFASVESETITIDAIDDNINLPVYKSSVLKSETRRDLPTLEYLFRFLDAYDFASEGKEGTQKANRSLINASVLGKVFEKINGYKDGSIYTPGFITMYMCRQAIRLAVVQKFKTAYDLDIETFDDLYVFVSKFHKTEKILEFNRHINDLKLCDPAVGSGHFLVSALNELLAVKSELGIFADADGKPFGNYEIKVANDEIIVTDHENREFRYIVRDGKPLSGEMQRLQTALFHEKQTLIENCLFGVDVNPNSVKICRLRLWIELLKNAYYKDSGELETLPNIDINIKQGNSLLSRFALDADLKQALKTRDGIKDYRDKVNQYKNERNRDLKRQLTDIIENIKKDFRVELNHLSKERIDLARLNNKLFEQESKQFLFGEDEKDKAERLKNIDDLKKKIKNQLEKITSIEENAIYRHAFEWRFEFPEVLDNDGNFLGFDIVIGNPPYGLFNKKQNQKIALETHNEVLKDILFRFPEATGGVVNASRIFYALGFRLLQDKGLNSMIIPFGILTDLTSARLRRFIFENHQFIKIDAFPERDNHKRRVFEDAKMSTSIILSSKEKKEDKKFDLGVSYIKAVNPERLTLTFEEIAILDNDLLQIPIINKDEYKVLLSIKENGNAVNLGKIQPCLTGEVDMTFGKQALTKNPNDSVLIKGVQIDKYITKLSKSEISQGEIEFLNVSKFEAGYTGEKLNHVSSNRIALQGLTGINETSRIKGNIVKDVFLANSVNYILESNQVNIKYLLALLNSKVINFAFRCKSTSSNVNGYEVDNLPIIISDNQKPFIKLVDEILELKKQGAETTEQEAEIDRLVYDLYELTQAEREIVGGNEGAAAARFEENASETI